MTAPSAHAVDASSFRDEARAELVAMFSQRSGSIGPEFLADHLLQLYPQEEWPLLRDAGRALMRRFDKAAADALVVASRPKGAWRGRYTTGRRRGPARPYRTQVRRSLADKLWSLLGKLGPEGRPVLERELLLAAEGLARETRSDFEGEPEDAKDLLGYVVRSRWPRSCVGSSAEHRWAR